MGIKYRIGYNQSCQQFPCTLCNGENEETCTCMVCYTDDPEEFCCCCTVFCKSEYMRCCKCGPDECALDCNECFRFDDRPQEPYVTWDRCCALVRCWLAALCIQNLFIFVTALIFSTLHFVFDVWKIIFGCLGCTYVESPRTCCTQLSCFCCICQMVPPSEVKNLDETTACCDCLYCTGDCFYSRWPCESFQELHAGTPTPIVINKESQVPRVNSKHSSPRVHRSNDDDDGNGEASHKASPRHEHSDRHHHKHRHHHHGHHSHNRDSEPNNGGRHHDEHQRDDGHSREHHSRMNSILESHSIKHVTGSPKSSRRLELDEKQSKSREKVVIDSIQQGTKGSESKIIECYYDDENDDHDDEEADADEDNLEVNNVDKQEYIRTSKDLKEKTTPKVSPNKLDTSKTMGKPSLETTCFSNTEYSQPGHSNQGHSDNPERKEPISVRMQRIRSNSMDRDSSPETRSDSSETSSTDESDDKAIAEDFIKPSRKAAAKSTETNRAGNEPSSEESKSSIKKSEEKIDKPDQNEAAVNKVMHESRADSRRPAMFRYENEKDRSKLTEGKVKQDKKVTVAVDHNKEKSNVQSTSGLPPIDSLTERFPLERSQKDSKKSNKDSTKVSFTNTEVKKKPQAGILKSASKNVASRPVENIRWRPQNLDLFVEDLSDTSLICDDSENDTKGKHRIADEGMKGSYLKGNETDKGKNSFETRISIDKRDEGKKRLDTNKTVVKARKPDERFHNKAEKEKTVYKMAPVEMGKDIRKKEIDNKDMVNNVNATENILTNTESHCKEQLELVTPARPKSDSALRKKLNDNSHFRGTSSDNVDTRQGSSTAVVRNKDPSTPPFERPGEENEGMICGSNSEKRRQRRERLATSDVRKSAENIEGISLTQTSPLVVGENTDQKEKSGRKKKRKEKETLHRGQ